jgi:PhnB protein
MLGVDSKEEADNLFAKLSVNGTIEMELQDTFWGDYYGSFSDQFGIQWMIDYEYPKA